jgi:hypothetical protein
MDNIAIAPNSSQSFHDLTQSSQNLVISINQTNKQTNCLVKDLMKQKNVVIIPCFLNKVKIFLLKLECINSKLIPKKK